MRPGARWLTTTVSRDYCGLNDSMMVLRGGEAHSRAAFLFWVTAGTVAVNSKQNTLGIHARSEGSD
jgi:hypothetical protein